MAVSINSNIAAAGAIRRLDEGTSRLAKTFERLSSGQRINRASDDAAGLAIASSLSADTRVYGQAIRNANDGISALNIAGGTVQELTSVLIRMRELAVQSANGSFSRVQRRSIDEEAEALTREYNRLVATSSFNGVRLLSGQSNQMTIQLGYGLDGTLRISSGSGISRTVGAGSFQAATALGTTVTANDIASADLNGDGKDDLVRANNAFAGGGVSFSLNNGSGAFTSSTNIVTGSSDTTSVFVSDINKDGKQDILATHDGGAISLMFGLGNGTFQTPVSISLGSAPSDVIVADMNNDGNADILAARANTIWTILGNGDGSFQAARSFAASSGNIEVGDFNGDGFKDVASAASTVSILYGNGQGGLGAAMDTGVSGTNVLVADFNRDGLSDFAVNGSNLGIVLNQGGGAFAAVMTYSGSLTDMALADFNNDGFIDIVGTAASGAGVWLGSGEGTFDTRISLGGQINHITVGDFNGDGATDVISARTATGAHSIHLANSTSSSNMQFLNLNTREGSLDALSVIDAALERINKETGNIGSSLSRLESAIGTLIATRENYESAKSRIQDADIAEESAQLSRLQILQQTASAVLAQANIQPQLALRLIGNI